MKRVFQIILWTLLIVGMGRMSLMAYEDRDIFGGLFFCFFIIPHAVFLLLAVSGFVTQAQKIPLVLKFFKKDVEKIYLLCFRTFPTLYKPEIGGRKAKHPVIHSFVSFFVFFPGELIFGANWHLSLLQIVLVVFYTLVAFSIREIEQKKIISPA